MQKTIIASAFAGAVCAVIGFGVGRETAPPAPGEGERIVAAAELDASVEREREAEETIAALRAEREQLIAEKEQLAGRVQRAEQALAAASAPPVEDAAATAPTTLSVAFGEWVELPEIRNADWDELAGAVVAINDLVLPLIEDLEAGRPPSSTLQRDIQEHNQTLVRHGVSLLEKIPTNAPMAVNGEFTHPINLINFIAGILENAGVPLDGRQTAEMAVIGEAYDREFAAMNAQYGEGTWELTKIIDELALKRDTMFEVERRLTPAQLQIVAIPKIQNRIRLDTLSPVNMVVLNVGPLVLDTRDELRADVIQGLTELGLPREAIDANLDLLERYEQEIAEVLERTVPRETAPFVHLDDIIVGGRALERYLADLSLRPELTEEVRSSISGLQSWWVPQLVQGEAPAAG